MTVSLKAELKSGRFLYAGFLLYNEKPISACRLLEVEGSYMQGFYCIMDEAISACRFLKVEGSYMQGFYCMKQFQPVGS